MSEKDRIFIRTRDYRKTLSLASGRTIGVKLASTFTPLAEMGLVTSLGVALTLAGGLWIIPAILVLTERQQDRKNTAAAG